MKTAYAKLDRAVFATTMRQLHVLSHRRLAMDISNTTTDFNVVPIATMMFLTI